MIKQSILDIRKDTYIKGLTYFVQNYIPKEHQVEAALELAKLMNLHFTWALDQYDLDKENIHKE